MDNLKLNYDDITIIPERITDISSRKECNPYDEDGFLPIFASCMTSVVSIENTKAFNDVKIRTVIPRSYSIDTRMDILKNNEYNFVAFSLSEAKDIFINKNHCPLIAELKFPMKICIDLANGHMKTLLDTVKEIKAIWGENATIMTGNIANPETYEEYEKAGVDFCRAGIGGGTCCTSSSNLGLHYPYFSLIKGLYEKKKSINGKCKIIADGNIRGYRDIQKALIYADYVMIGGLFNKAIESAGKTTYGKSYFNIRGYKFMNPFKTLLTYGKEIKPSDYDKEFKKVKNNTLTIWKEVYGQSTKKAQQIMAEATNTVPKKLKTSEGIIKYQKAEYTLKGWAENETDFLRSAMSYTNSKTLEEFKDSQWVKITQIRYNN